MLSLDKVFNAQMVLKNIIRETHVVRAYGIAPDCEFVELFVDGDYLGVYLLTEKIKKIADVSTTDNKWILLCQNNKKAKLDHPESAVSFSDKVYFEIVDDMSLQPVEFKDLSNGIIGCIAVYVGDVRLIDNIRYK